MQEVIPTSFSEDVKTKEITTIHLTHVLIFTLAFVIVLAAFVLIWDKYPQLLYIYRDGEYNLWISLKYTEWASPFGMTSINPFQGMTSMLVTINPYFNPGQWPFFTKLPPDIKIITSYAIYALELMLSTLALGIAFGFSRLHSFVASIWVILLLFPPFNFFFGVGGWFCGAPMYGHAIALTNLSFIACLNLGTRRTPYQTKLRVFQRNLLLVGVLILLILAIMFAAPFYNAGILLGTALVLCGITLCSLTREQFYWRVFAGLAVIATFYTLGLPEFYTSAKAYSARYIENQPLVAIGWPSSAGYFNNQETIARAWSMLCAYGVHCAAFPGWPISINTGWLNASIVLGGITAWLTIPRSAARIGIFVAVTWIIILLSTILSSFGILSLLFAPYCFYLMMFSLLALYSLNILTLPIKIALDRARIGQNSILLSFLALGIALAVSLWLVNSLHANREMAARWQKVTTSLTQVMLEERHSATSITQLLRKEIALQPGTRFRGSVATIYGTADGTLRRAPGVSQTATIAAGQFEEFLTAAAQSGSSHDLLDLWIWNIPTLSEYGQGVSHPLMFYMSKFLSSPGDANESHFAFPHLANVDILQALGVRFVIIDAPLLGDSVTLRRQLRAGDNATLFLYELSAPNLGDYSPTRLHALNSVTEFYRKIHANPKSLKTDAYVEAPLKVDLTPAYDAKMIYQKNGIHVTAKSNGTSALLLPVQFSHCYRPRGPSNGKIKIMRANLIHTLVIFNGDLDINLVWEYRWGQSKCRQQDVTDTKDLVKLNRQEL